MWKALQLIVLYWWSCIFFQTCVGRGDCGIVEEEKEERSFHRSRLAPRHSWTRTPRILRARGGGVVYYIKFVSYYNGIRRLRVVGFITLTPCVPR